MKKTQVVTSVPLILFCLIAFQFMFVLPAAAQNKAAQEKPVEDKDMSTKETVRKWKDYAKTENGVEYFYDKDSMLHEGEHVLQVWRRRVFPPKSAQQEIISFDEINCKLQVFRTLELQVIYWDNNTETFKKVSGWSNVYSGYPEEYFIEKYCP